MSENDKVKITTIEEKKNNQVGIPMNIAMKTHFELEIDALQNALRDIEKLKQLLQIKERSGYT